MKKKMQPEVKTSEVRDLMTEFAEETGIFPTKSLPSRYLWTDAFAVCNFLTLYGETGEKEYLRLALTLIDQVHHILGKHRHDDPRTGWISGLSEKEGLRHPTAGGLRIGKKLNERGPDDPYDEPSEWDRDGQYFHYLTKWMHALCRTSVVTWEPQYCRWAVELAKAAHVGFCAPQQNGEKGLSWKMSIDLSYPLVPSMGLHDPLDALITYHELYLCAQQFAGDFTSPDLSSEISDTITLCENQRWDTNDPLGIGGLLWDACRVFQMMVEGRFKVPGVLEALLVASKNGLDFFARHAPLNNPAEFRLAFRELGLSIGLRAVEKMQDLLPAPSVSLNNSLHQDLENLMGYVPLSELIENFWRTPANQRLKSWHDHRDINMVMLATSLSPKEFLAV